MQHPYKAFFWAIVIVLSSMASLPFTRFLGGSFDPHEIMLVRAFVIVPSIVVFTGQIPRMSLQLAKAGAAYAVATLCILYAIQRGGVNGPCVVIMLTPVVTACVEAWRGKPTDRTTLTLLALLFVGVVVALEPWGAVFDRTATMYALCCVVMGAVGNNYIGDPRFSGLERTSVIALLGCAVALLVCVYQMRMPFAGTITPVQGIVLAIIGVSCLAFFVGHSSMYTYLDKTAASVVVMLQTPASILGAWLILGETMSWQQLAGAVVAFLAPMALSLRPLWQKYVLVNRPDG